MESAHIRLVPRYPFFVDIELTDLHSQIQIKARTKELSLFGCGVHALESFPRGANVWIKIFHGDRYIVAHARVVYTSPGLGMGVVFIGIAPEHERILEGWIVELLAGSNNDEPNLR